MSERLHDYDFWNKYMENHILPDVSVRVRALSDKQLRANERRFAQSVIARDCVRLRLQVSSPDPVIHKNTGIVATLDCRSVATGKRVLAELRKFLASLDGVILEP